jgi:hypothetical protein
MAEADNVSQKIAPSPGGKPMPLLGIQALALYLISLAIFCAYVLIKIWPHSTPALSSETKPGPAADPVWIVFFWREAGYWIWAETRLLLIVMLSGALGSLVHAIRSFFWYTGNRRLVRSWSAMYVLLPFNGTILAVILYLVIRGGFFSPSSSVDVTSPFGFAAIGALIGLFSREAVHKLKQVAETFFAAAEQGKDRASTGLAVTAVNPTSGPTTGGTTATITGSGFANGAAVSFDKMPATSISVSGDNTVTAVTPPHPAAGIVDVVVTNPDGKSGKLTGGYTYVAPLADGAPASTPASTVPPIGPKKEPDGIQ